MPVRIPPHDSEAEKSLLACIMLNSNAFGDVAGIVKASDFYDKAHQEIFEAMAKLDLEGQTIDAVTVANELKKRGSLKIAGGTPYLADLMTAVASTANAEGYAHIIAEKAQLRELILTADEMSESSFNEQTDAREIIDNAEERIFDIAKERQSRDYSPIKDVFSANFETFDKIAKQGGKLVGIPSGFTELDEITHGFQKSALIIIAARPAMGKSAFALNIALNAAREADASVLIFNLEMSKEQLGQRLLSMAGNIELEKIVSGHLEDEDFRKLMYVVDELSKKNIYIDDTSSISVMEIKNKCRRLKVQHGLDLVIIDYMQLMDAQLKNGTREQEVAKISREMKLIAKELECPVIVLSQLSRAPEKRDNKRPLLADLRESGSLEQDADMVIFLYRDEYYNKDKSETPGECEVIVAKNRNGRTKTVNLAWVERYARFNDLAKHRPEE
ncbi:MAG: replicative DNA helicase [Eubacterium sp.]|jgi:replicative DNA helicase